MTTIDIRRVAQGGDIPDDLPPTLEALLFFLGGKYNQIYGAKTYAELQGSAVDPGFRTIASADVVQTPAGPRGIIRASMPMDADWLDNGALYLRVNEQSQAVLP